MEQEVIQEVNLRDLLTALQRRWWVFLSVFAALTFASIAATSRMPRIYEAASQIQVKAPTPTNGAFMPMVNADTYKQTQLALLSNPAVADQIVEYLKAEKDRKSVV